MINTTTKTLLFSALPLFLLPLNAQAQIAPDGTTSTTVTPTATGVQIDNGDRAGGNLFHSFQDFSIPTGSEAHFNNANDIANIFSRVTGGNVSDIDGLIRANGTANLFLINPNGIIFGENASLQLGGSFFATTADGILFDDGVAFSASDPTVPLLTSSIPIGANFRGQPGDITNLAGNIAPNSQISQLSPGLTISSGETITLLGGNVTFDGGQIIAPEGINVEIGGLTAEGTVRVAEGNSLENGRLIFPEDVERGDITFTNISGIGTVPFVNLNRASRSININGKNINVRDSLLVTGAVVIAEESEISEAGDITLNAQGGSIQLSNSGIISESGSNLTNDFAEIELTASQGSISIVNNSVISAANSSPEGLAGDIILNASNEINISDSNIGTVDNPFSLLGTNETNRGNGNNARIFIGSHPIEEVTLPSKVSIQGTKQESGDFTTNIDTSNLGREDNGLAGSIEINAIEEIQVSGSRINSVINTSSRNRNDGEDNNFSRIKLSVTEGNINLTQAEINTDNTNRIGLAGDIFLNASDSVSIINSTVTTTGNNGQIFIGDSITPSQVTITGQRTGDEFTTVLSTTNNQESTDRAGLIDIKANSRIDLSSSQLTTTSSNTEFAGDITLNASDEIKIENSNVETNGRFGIIAIGTTPDETETTPPTKVTINGSSIQATNESVPPNIPIKVDENGNPINEDGNLLNENEPPVIEPINSGEILIFANQNITLSDGSKISNFTRRTGNAGSVTISSNNGEISLDNSDIFSNVENGQDEGGIGDGGNITITGNSLLIDNGSQIQSLVREGFVDDEIDNPIAGQGDAGNIVIDVDGEVKITGKNDDNFPSLVTTKVQRGNLIDAETEEYSPREENLRAGNITINAGSLAIGTEEPLTTPNEISSSTQGTGLAGDIIINTSGEINIQNSNIETNGNFGRIFIGSVPEDRADEGITEEIPSKVIIQGTRSPDTENQNPLSDFVFTTNVSSTNLGRDNGEAGIISIFASEEINVSGSSLDSNTEIVSLKRPESEQNNNFSRIILQVIENNSEGTISLNQSEINNTNSNIGFAGDIILDAPDSIEITDSQLLANGRNGRILIGQSTSLQSITIKDFSTLSTTNSSVPIDDTEINENEDTVIDTINSGDISISANENISLNNNSTINAFTVRKGDAGDVTLNAGNSITLQDASQIRSETFADGNPGTVTIGGRGENLPDVSISGVEVIRNEETNNDDILSSGIFTVVAPIFEDEVLEDGESLRQGGNITINVNSLTLENGAQINASTGSTFGLEKGRAGDINIDVTNEVKLDGFEILTLTNQEGTVSEDVPRNSAIISSVFSDANFGSANAQGGNIIINAGSLSLENGGLILAQIDGIFNNSEIFPDAPAANGTAGNITLIVDGAVNLSGFSTPEVNGNQNLVSNVISSVVGLESTVLDSDSQENGNIVINADSLLVSDFSVISSATFGIGNAGDVDINVNNSIDLIKSGQIRTNVESGAEGIAGDIDIEANSLTLEAGGQIGSVVFRPTFRLEELGGEIPAGIGEAGDIYIDVDGEINISGIAEAIEEPNLINSFTGTSLITGVESSGIYTSAERNTTRLNSEQEQAAGDITITSGGKISVSDGALINALTSNDGNAGNITITANELELTGGGQILATTRGSGDAGNINLDIQNNLAVSGSDSNFQQRLNRVEAQINQSEESRPENERSPIEDIINNQGAESGIFANTQAETTGDGGNISINIFERDDNDLPIFTPTQLQLSVDEGLISASTLGEGDAGSLQINAQALTLDRGGQVLSFTNSSGRGGSLIVNASDSITLNSRVNESNFTIISTRTESNGNAGDLTLNTRQLNMQGNASIESIAFDDNTGDAGDVAIDLINQFPPNNDSDGTLTMIGEENNRPKISVDSNTGTAGNIDITANFIEQDGGEITANTESTGANIDLNVRDFWFLRNESLVSADATRSGNQQSTGGNININSNNEDSDLIIIAFPAAEEGNDITANGFGADAGQIDINANLLGIRVRNTEPGETGDNFLNDITARSDISSENNVEQSNVEDPSSSLVELPESVGDASDTIAQNPCEQGVGSEFLITGKGGFPANPQNNFSSNQVRVGLVQPVTSENQTATVGENNVTSTEESEVVPAQGWVFNDEGKVVLTAYDPTNKGVQRNQQFFTGCSIPQN